MCGLVEVLRLELDAASGLCLAASTDSEVVALGNLFWWTVVASYVPVPCRCRPRS